MRFSFLRWVFHQRWLTFSKKVHEWLMKGFERHADQGNQDAQELYGFLLLHKGVDEKSQSAGARYLMMCVAVNRPKVCWQLYHIFQRGHVLGFKSDQTKANYYLDMAKQGGHPLALET